MKLQTYDLKNSQQEFDRTKADLNALETKLKWSQNSLKTEIELNKVTSFISLLFTEIKLCCVNRKVKQRLIC